MATLKRSVGLSTVQGISEFPWLKSHGHIEASPMAVMGYLHGYFHG